MAAEGQEDASLAVQIREEMPMHGASQRDEALQSYSPSDGRLSSGLPGSDLLFVTWIAFGEYGDGGLKAHNFHKVDMR